MAESNKKFVIQKHIQGNGVHWDLMLQAGDVLETYRLAIPPEKIIGDPVEAIKIFDHSLRFLTYEGSVNKGTGTVEIADSGTYKIHKKTDSQMDFQFDGKILQGRFILTHIKENCWDFKLAADR